MYQAIVFLPLLGAIVAGFITMVGARLRHPGAEPGVGAEDHAAPSSGHAAPVAGGAVVHVAHHEPHDETDDHSHGHEHAPAALGARPAELNKVRTVGVPVSGGAFRVDRHRTGTGGESRHHPSQFGRVGHGLGGTVAWLGE